MTRRKTTPFDMALGALGAGLMLSVLIVAHGLAAQVERTGPGAIETVIETPADPDGTHMG